MRDIYLILLFSLCSLIQFSGAQSNSFSQSIFNLSDSEGMPSDQMAIDSTESVRPPRGFTAYASMHILVIGLGVEKRIPYTEDSKLNLVVGGGVASLIAFIESPVVAFMGTVKADFGPAKHGFEVGINAGVSSGGNGAILAPYLGFRYQNPKGFHLKAGFLMFDGILFLVYRPAIRIETANQ